MREPHPSCMIIDANNTFKNCLIDLAIPWMYVHATDQNGLLLLIK